MCVVLRCARKTFPILIAWDATMTMLVFDEIKFEENFSPHNDNLLNLVMVSH